VWSKENPLEQDAKAAAADSAVLQVIGANGVQVAATAALAAASIAAAGSSNMDNLQSRTASKAKRVRVDLMEGVKMHRLIKKNKRRFEQEQNPVAIDPHQEPPRLVKRQRRELESSSSSSSSSGPLATLLEGDDEDDTMADEQDEVGTDGNPPDATKYSPLLKLYNGQMRYDWTQDPAYLAKMEEGKAICCLTPVEQATYKYLVHVEHTTNHRLWEMPIPDESVACHSQDSSTRSQDSMPNKGGNWVVNGKIKTMMRTPRLKYDFPFLFLVGGEHSATRLQALASFPPFHQGSVSLIRPLGVSLALALAPPLTPQAHPASYASRLLEQPGYLSGTRGRCEQDKQSANSRIPAIWCEERKSKFQQSRDSMIPAILWGLGGKRKREA
jgi:hypothetical protein